jgi:hypothetical protein
VKKAIVVFAVALCAGLALAQDAGQSWSFTDDEVGAVPKGWTPAQTAGQGLLASWAVAADPSAPEPPKVVQVMEARNSGKTFNLLLKDGSSFQDLDLSVKVKSVSGKEDQGGGPVWRALDANNYYVARWNPLENNFRVYVVKDGKRKLLGSADVKADPAKWHEINIRMVGERITAQFDESTFVEVQDATVMKPGQVGLWTKADAAAAFDQLTAKAATPESGETPSPPMKEEAATPSPK